MYDKGLGEPRREASEIRFHSQSFQFVQYDPVTRQRTSRMIKSDGMSLSNQPLAIAGRIFRSRLILGTGKFSSPEAMRDALAASGAEMVTVALRRADLSGKKDPFANILEFVDPEKY